MWRIAKVICEGIVFIDLFWDYCIICLLTHKVTTKIIKAYLFFSLLDYLAYYLFLLLLVNYQKLTKSLPCHDWAQVMIVVIKFKIGIFLKNWLHFFTAMHYLEIVSNFIMTYFCFICQGLIVNFRIYSLQNFPISWFLHQTNCLGNFQYIWSFLFSRNTIFDRLHCVKLHYSWKKGRINMHQIIVDDIIV
jgi:hypothetical protein